VRGKQIPYLTRTRTGVSLDHRTVETQEWRRGVALISVAESLHTGSAAGKLVLNIMTAVSQWEREAIGERTRDALSHKRSNGERIGTSNSVIGYAPTANTSSQIPANKRCCTRSTNCADAAKLCGELQRR
jgi:DNA invertase Pin-like site-specific DNA recombinase